MKSGQGNAAGKKRRWPRVAMWAAAALLVAISAVALDVYVSVKHAADRMYQPLPADQPKYVSRDPEMRQQPSGGEGTAAQPRQVVVAAATGRQAAATAVGAAASGGGGKRSPGAFTALLLGVDQRPGDRGRSDTMLVMTVNPDSGKALLYNIPRDTRTLLVKRGFEDKINHAYAYNGVAGSVATVENFIDLPIDYYVQINMEGFETLVDLLGGVDVNNPFAFDYEGRAFPKGEQHLNGELALKYSRMRFDDPRGDFGRNERQRQVVKDMLHQASQWEGIASFKELLGTMGDHVRTNLTFDQMQTIFLKYRTKIDTIQSTEIKGQGTRIGGIYYYLVGDAERTRIHDAMKAVLLGN